MRWIWRKDRSGQDYISFSYYDPIAKKNRRLKKSDVPSDITNAQKADEFVKSKQVAIATTTSQIKRKLEWRGKYHDFDMMEDLFAKHLECNGYRTHKNIASYISQYVFPFFLLEKNCNLMPEWPHHYEDFKIWLRTSKKPKQGKSSVLEYSSCNNIISALNSFLKVMEIKKILPDTVKKCPKFESNKLNTRDINHVLTDQEIIDVHTQLVNISKNSADFFLLLLKTGMRRSEGLGISVADINSGRPNNKTLDNALKQHEIECYGYLSIKSQLDNPNDFINLDGSIKRAPLKGKKTVSSKDVRLIPISDRSLFNLLVDRYNEVKDLKTPNDSDKLLFKNLKGREFDSDIRKAYENLKGKYTTKSAHNLRHTFSTYLCGNTEGNYFLCKLILGHSDDKTTARYTHIFEDVSRSVTQAETKKHGLQKV